MGEEATLHSGFSFMLPSLVVKYFIIGLFSLLVQRIVHIGLSCESFEAMNNEIAFCRLRIVRYQQLFVYVSA